MLFIGLPGVSKTTLTVGLARATVEAGHRVYFSTATVVAARCHNAANAAPAGASRLPRPQGRRAISGGAAADSGTGHGFTV